MTFGLFIAAALPEATERGLGDSAVGLGVVLLLVLQILNFFRRTPPIEAEFATKAELEAIRDKVDDDLRMVEGKIEVARTESREQFNEIIRAGETRSENIFRRINDVSTSLNDKIDAVPLQVIKTLKSTGAI